MRVHVQLPILWHSQIHMALSFSRSLLHPSVTARAIFWALNISCSLNWNTHIQAVLFTKATYRYLLSESSVTSFPFLIANVSILLKISVLENSSFRGFLWEEQTAGRRVPGLLRGFTISAWFFFTVLLFLTLTDFAALSADSWRLVLGRWSSHNFPS